MLHTTCNISLNYEQDYIKKLHYDVIGVFADNSYDVGAIIRL